MLPAFNPATVPAPALPAKVYLKVCGMREPDNILAVAAQGVDFLGFIFYPDSPRYAGATLAPELLRSLPTGVLKVGVFVNEDSSHILHQVAAYGLDLVQLHGTESPAQCAELRAAHVPVIQAFSVGPGFDFGQLIAYVPHCTYFLFDTKGAKLGGNGTVFDWSVLEKYSLPVPYFLAGGIDVEHAEYLKENPLPGLFSIDLNSRFETAPGVKDVPKLSKMICQMKNHNRA